MNDFHIIYIKIVVYNVLEFKIDLIICILVIRDILNILTEEIVNPKR